MLPYEETCGWSDVLAHYSYYGEAELRPVMARLAELVVKANAKLDDSRAKRVVSLLRRASVAKLESCVASLGLPR